MIFTEENLTFRREGDRWRSIERPELLMLEGGLLGVAVRRELAQRASAFVPAAEPQDSDSDPGARPGSVRLERGAGLGTGAPQSPQPTRVTMVSRKLPSTHRPRDLLTISMYSRSCSSAAFNCTDLSRLSRS